MLLNVFINDQDEGIKCALMSFGALMSFADIPKLGGEGDTSGGSGTLQEDLDRLEERTSKNLMKFNKDKFKILYLEDIIQENISGWHLPVCETVLYKWTWGSWGTTNSV